MDKQWWSKKKLWQGAIVLVTFFFVCVLVTFYFSMATTKHQTKAAYKRKHFIGARGSRGLEAPANVAGRELGSKEAGMVLEQ